MENLDEIRKIAKEMTQKIKNNEDYLEESKKISDFLSILESILLNDPNNAEIIDLLSKEMFKLIEAILDQYFIENEELANRCMEILLHYSMFDDEKYPELVKKIDFNPVFFDKNPFYINNDYKPPYKKSNLILLKEGGFQMVSSTMLRLNNELSELNTLLARVAIDYRSGQKEYVKNFILLGQSQLATDMKRISDLYIEFIQPTTDIKLINQSFDVFISCIKNDLDKIYKVALNISKFLISKKVDDQILAAQIFSDTIVLLAPDKGSPRFTEFCKNLKFMDLLLSEHHSAVINELKKASKFLINVDDLINFWNLIIKNSHSSESKHLLDFILTVIQGFNNEDIKKFVDFLKKEQRNEKTIDLLSNFYFCRELIPFCFISCIEIGMEINDIRNIIDGLNYIERFDYEEELKIIIKFISDNLQNNGCVTLLRKFLSTNDGYRLVMVEDLENKIINCLKSKSDKNEDLILILVEHPSNVKDEHLIYLFENCMCYPLLKLFNFCLENIDLNEETIEFVMKQIKSKMNFVDVDRETAQQIQRIFITLNVREGLVEKTRFSFIPTKLPLIHVDLIFKCFLKCTDDGGFNLMKRVLTRIYRLVDDIESIQSCKAFFSMISNERTSILDFKILQLTNDLLIRFGASLTSIDWGYEPHYIDIVNDTVFFYVFDENCQKIKFRFFDYQQIEEVMNAIAWRLKVYQPFELHRIEGEVLQLNKDLNTSGVNNGDEFILIKTCEGDDEEIKRVIMKNERQIPLTVFMHLQKIQNYLLSNIPKMDEQSKSVAVAILNNLPDDEDLVYLAENDINKLIDFIQKSDETVSEYAFHVLVNINKTAIDADFINKILPEKENLLTEEVLEWLSALSEISICVPKLIKILNAKPSLVVGKMICRLLAHVLHYELTLDDIYKFAVNLETDIFRILTIFISSNFDGKKLIDFCFEKMDEHNNFIVLLDRTIKGIIESDLDFNKILKNCFEKLTDKNVFYLQKVIGNLTHRKELLNYVDYSNQLLNFAFQSIGSNILFDILIAMSNNGHLPQETEDLITEECQNLTNVKKCQEMDFRDESTHCLGLKNLGMTCYMNSIFQLLFSIKPFCKVLFEMEEKKESDKYLKNIFRRLQNSICSYVDTEEFCKTFVGWGNEKINVRQQQDASEFFNTLIDKLSPEIQNIFKGEILNEFKAEDDATKKVENGEFFFTIPIKVKDFEDLNQSYADFSSPDILDYRFDDKLRKATKTSSIKTFPDVLVFALKRFDYDIMTGERFKVNTKFTFPYEMLDGYKLRGVVLHSGFVDAGHYTSIVKKGDTFIYFNDLMMKIISKAQFEEMAYGGIEGDESAFLLFYVKENSELFKGENNFVYKDEEIEKENEVYIKNYNILSESFYTLVCKLDNPNLLINYILNVYPYLPESTMKKMMIDDSRNLIKDTIHNMFENNGELFDYILSNIELLKEKIKTITDERILLIFKLLCDEVFNKYDEEICHILASELFSLFGEQDFHLFTGQTIYNLVTTYIQKGYLTEEEMGIIEDFKKKCEEVTKMHQQKTYNIRIGY